MLILVGAVANGFANHGQGANRGLPCRMIRDADTLAKGFTYFIFIAGHIPLSIPLQQHLQTKLGTLANTLI
jgi:hypothetical protein